MISGDKMFSYFYLTIENSKFETSLFIMSMKKIQTIFILDKHKETHSSTQMLTMRMILIAFY